MPTLIIKTNVSVERSHQEQLLRAASTAVAEMLGKPEQYVMVIIEPLGAMLFGGEPTPAAYLELKSLGLPEQQTADYSATLCALLQEHLGVPPARVYIEFATPPRHMFGYDGRTF